MVLFVDVSGYDEACMIDPTTFKRRIPAHPKYASYEARLQSFEKYRWPARLPQKPEVLAAAGFFYEGNLTFFDSLSMFLSYKGLLLV